MRRYETLPKATYEACQAIVRPLIAFALECGSQSEFKEKLDLVIQTMTHVDSEELGQYIYAVPRAVDGEMGQYVYAVPRAVDGDVAQYVYAVPYMDDDLEAGNAH